MKRIISYSMKYWYFYLVGFVAMGISIALDMVSPKLIQQIIDEVIKKNNHSIFTSLLVGLLLITLLRAILGYIKEYTIDYAAIKAITCLRKDLFNHIQSLSLSFFDSRNTGELMTRVKDDTDKVFQGISFGIMLVVEITIYFVIAVIFMFLISPKLALLSIITVPVIGYLAIQLEKNVGEIYEKISEENAILNTIAQENIAGVRLVKAFVREKYEINKFLESNKIYYKLNLEQSTIFSNYFPKIQMIADILPTMVVVFGGALVIQHNLSIGTLVQFNIYMSMLISPMRMMGRLMNVMAEAMARAKKINKIFDEKSDINIDSNSVQKNAYKGSVKFKNVSLQLGDKKVLKNINFKIESGKTLGIMGVTGSGKTSIINLLIRFYDTTEGNVMIDDVDVKKIDLKQLREQTSIVMQDVFLFSDTIVDNIRLGTQNNIETDKMIEVSKQAQAFEFVNQLDDKFNTIIGERGLGLSGGQKQRISIIRALAKDCPILVFDDSTSALDMETEYKIQKAIDAMKDKTKIIIAHRISAVKNADEIIILDNGEIIERGTHHQLLEKKGHYYETYIEQYGDYKAV